MVTKATFVGAGFTRKPPKYERFIRPSGLRFTKAHVTHPELKCTFNLEIIGVKKNPNGPMYTSLGVITKGTIIEVIFPFQDCTQVCLFLVAFTNCLVIKSRLMSVNLVLSLLLGKLFGVRYAVLKRYTWGIILSFKFWWFILLWIVKWQVNMLKWRIILKMMVVSMEFCSCSTL